MVNSICISVESDQVSTCKLELKPWHFWARKGYKTFMVDGNQLELYWDFRSAKFSGPEPNKDFNVALVFDEELVLLLGDMEKKAQNSCLLTAAASILSLRTTKSYHTCTPPIYFKKLV
ncbi:uncharacterized protein LOC131003966 [Salvia miltiorrhiza]|uniref:uncharacterized protein LOC131003966 n=1 Tax=Salvia miltiorrhiza TaxID=226208 RepID=UPI0025ABA2AD|nr:uncharacterized protein LOC131003966 [Salvia miltiorrhiza]